jgi:hypothetical protein
MKLHAWIINVQGMGHQCTGHGRSMHTTSSFDTIETARAESPLIISTRQRPVNNRRAQTTRAESPLIISTWQRLVNERRAQIPKALKGRDPIAPRSGLGVCTFHGNSLNSGITAASCTKSLSL